MAPVTPMQNSFSAGELSPLIDGRTDIARYFSGAKTLENYIVLPYGGAKRRPGTYYVLNTKTNQIARFEQFQFNTEQAYMLEFTNLLMRVYKDQGVVLSGVDPYELVTPYLEADLFDLQFAQDADTAFITHPSYKTRELTRTGHAAWTIKNYAPELLTLDVAPGGAGWAAGETVTGNTSGKTSIIVEVLTTKTYRIKNRTGAYTLGEVLTNGTATADQGAAHPTTTGDPFGADASDDCPTCVSIHEQRLFLANTNNNPQKIWGSVSGDYQDMTTGADAADALTYVIGSQEVNAVRWLSSGLVLNIGTLGGVFKLWSGSESLPLTPTNKDVKKETSYGSICVMPKRIGNFVYYIQSDGKTVRELGTRLTDAGVEERDAYDTTVLAEHIVGEGIVQMAYQKTPYNILWCVRSDGQLACLTREISQKVLAWTRQVLGGSFGAGDAVVESVGVIPGDDGADEVWLVVKRTIDGSTVRHVEYLKPFDYGTEQEDAFYVDSGLSLDSPLVITGITNATTGVVTIAETMTLDVAPASPGWYVGDTIEGDTSGETCVIVQILTTKTYIVKDRSGDYTLGEILTNGTITADQGAANPVLTGHGLSNTDIVIIRGVEGMTEVNRTKYLIAGKTDTTFELNNAGSAIDAYVKLLMHLDGTDGSTDFLDSIGTHTITAEGAAQIDTAQSKFGGASGLFNGVADFLNTPAHADFEFGAGDFTIDFWVRFSTFQPCQFLSQTNNDNYVNSSWSIECAVGNLFFNFTDGSSTSLFVALDDDFENNTWYHLAVVRNGANVIFFKDGIKQGASQDISTRTISTCTRDLTIGSGVKGPNVEFYFVAGHMDEIRISKGVARWTTDFTVPAEPYSLGDAVDTTDFEEYISDGEARECVNSVSGADHLEDESVDLFIDGISRDSAVVDGSGAVAITDPTNGGGQIALGLGYVSTIQTMRIEGGSEEGTAQSKLKRLGDVFVRLYRSIKLKVGNVDKRDIVNFNKETVDDFVSEYTGDKRAPMPSKWDRDGYIVIKQDEPLPSVISALIIHLNSSE